MDIKKTIALRLAITLLFASTILLFPVKSEEASIPEEPPSTRPETLEKTQAVPPAVGEDLKKIAWCESKNRQFNSDGSIHRGEINPQDVGKYQINEHYHLEASIVLGIDIYTLEGNTEYAQYLYSTQGTTPWNWSKHCWSDPNRVWQKDGEDYTSF